MNRTNLIKLGRYVAALPADYREFDMSAFAVNYSSGRSSGVAPKDILGGCGTVCCLAGHGPLAGITPRQNCWDWDEYCDEAFETSRQEWGWLFYGSWCISDNTPHGGAKRIAWLLDHGAPKDWGQMMYGHEPLCYADIDISPASWDRRASE